MITSTTHPARVLVTDASRASSLAVIRSLGRAGHAVVVADSKPHPLGSRSRFAVGVGQYPSPFVESAEATAGAIASIARRHRIDVIVPVTDDVIVPLAHYRDALPQGCLVAMADDEARGRAASKVGTGLLARSLAIPQPRHEIVHQPEDAGGCTERLGVPVVIKPDRSRIIGPDGRLQRGSVSYAWTDREAIEAVRRAGQTVLLQSLHPGVGHGIGLLMSDGRPLAAVQHRRLHEVPVSGGASAQRETVPADRDLLSMACAMLGELNWTGAAMVEFKVGPSGPALMEINGRLWGSLPLAIRAGIDIPKRMLQVHLGDAEVCAAPLDLSYRPFVRSRNLDLELVWIGTNLLKRQDTSGLIDLDRRAALTAACDLLRRGQGDDLTDPDDLRPMVSGVGHAFAHIVHKARHHG
ncbi:MAG: ATP-grasp domain-containing protein [Aquihabitans sp.]